MKILLVRPDYPDPFFKREIERKKIFNQLMAKMASSFPKPLTFPLLASSISNKHSIDIFEGEPNKLDLDKKYDLVGITCITATADLAYQIADKYRGKDVTVVLGGWHPSALPKEAKKHADAVVIGEAEETWPQLIKDYSSKGKIKPYYIPKKPVPPNKIPNPQTDIYPNGTNMAFQATRGCPYGCEFCAITNMKFRNKFRKRPIKEVIKEIKSYTNKSFAFHDNSLTINVEYTKQLFREMKGLNKKFTAMGNINILGKDDELLKLAQEAGCVTWLVGFESISQNSLNSIGKKSNLVKKYPSAIKKIHNYGMTIVGSFVFGFDHDHIDIFSRTDDFVRKNEIDLPEALILTPFPGTPLYKKLEREGRIISKNWCKYTARYVVFQPKNMTQEQLFNNTRKLCNKWYKTSEIIKRTMKSTKFGLHTFINTPIRNLYIKAWL